ncbi:MalY/PatB family protein [Nesterenkonia flava]|uniref:cysteine-S-conjugate beta-lyase n=1 Tax=Nesterenkonia flava TaxID=469799 RepID=A0ABU1FTH9_9MICC|nr:MalY/PatB family protein [Nesterenkonia flava]MDR5711957.1 MalY/PatB family protein [Nesterenkonia flava]
MGEIANPLEQLSLATLRQRTSAKWRTYPADVLPLWVAEMDVPLAEPVADALRRVIELGDTGYPAGTAYAESLASFASRRWGWSPDPSLMRPVPDVMRGAAEAIKVLTSPGDAVVVNSPVYPPFFVYTQTEGRRVIESPLTPSGRLDLDGLERSFSEARTTSSSVVYLLCSPQNPTGAVHSRSELEAVAALARRHGVHVVVDEIHAPLVPPTGAAGIGPTGAADGPEFVPYLSVDPHGISLMSASKAWNLPGLKAALLIPGEEAAPYAQALPKELQYGPSHVGLLAQTAAYTHGEPWLDALLQGLAANRELLASRLPELLPAVEWTPPEATYLAWLDFTAYGFDDAPTPGIETPAVDTPAPESSAEAVARRGPARFLLKEAKVALTAGHPFGTGGQRHARLNFATSQEILTEALERMSRALSSRL